MHFAIRSRVTSRSMFSAGRGEEGPTRERKNANDTRNFNNRNNGDCVERLRKRLTSVPRSRQIKGLVSRIKYRACETRIIGIYKL